MFTAIQQIIGSGKPREAESADARMGLHQHQKNNVRNNLGKLSENRENIYDYEHNEIAVRSALLFLEGFLENKLERIARVAEDVDLMLPWMTGKTSNQNTSSAVQAYDHAAEISSKSSLNVAKNRDRKSEELGKVYHLIQDLRVLLDQGVEYLKIESGMPFMDAIDRAVGLLRVKAS